MEFRAGNIRRTGREEEVCRGSARNEGLPVLVQWIRVGYYTLEAFELVLPARVIPCTIASSLVSYTSESSRRLRRPRSMGAAWTVVRIVGRMGFLPTEC